MMFALCSNLHVYSPHTLFILFVDFLVKVALITANFCSKRQEESILFADA